MLYFILLSVSTTLFLLGFLVYTDYKDNITFRGERFSESLFVRKVINFFMPSPKRVRSLDTKLFYLFNDVTVRDYVMFKVILSCCAIVLSTSIVFTNYFNAKEKVFTKYRNIPFTISENDYHKLIENVRFSKMDMMKNQNIILSNAKYTDNYQRYLTVDSQTLYDTLQDITVDLSKVGGLKMFAMFIVLALLIIKLPDIILYQLNKILIKDMDFEFAKLESYIYANVHKKPEIIIRGLSYEAVIFRKYFTVFLTRYREDPEMSIDLMLNSPGINGKFKQLVEYILLIRTSDADRVRAKILINQANHMTVVKSSILSSINTKKTICNTLNIASFLLAIISIIFGILMSSNMLNLGGM